MAVLQWTMPMTQVVVLNILQGTVCFDMSLWVLAYNNSAIQPFDAFFSFFYSWCLLFQYKNTENTSNYNTKQYDIS